MVSRGWKRRVVLIGAAALLFIPATAAAQLPSGNLLANGSADAGQPAVDASDWYPPASWVSHPAFVGRATAVVYGAAGGFPSIDQGLALDGGFSFFAGGPPAPNDDDSALFRERSLTQIVEIPADELPEVKQGSAVATLTGCLGGYGSQDDAVSLSATYSAGIDRVPNPGGPTLNGPSAAERGGQTELLPRAASVPVDPGATEIHVTVAFVRTSGAATYSDGYADNLGLWLSNPRDPKQPRAACGSVGRPGGGSGTPGSGGGGGGNGGGNGGGGGTPVSAPFLVSAAAGSARLSGSRSAIAVPLACGGHDAPCAGSVGLSVPSLPRASSVKLGSASFSIAPGATQAVRVKLGRNSKKRLARLSRRQLRRLPVTATVTMDGASKSFKLRLTG
jgi:hypothetical protein